jgi:enamine deaminase RidA (YjgF/YER057c/UK114 family)
MGGQTKISQWTRKISSEGVGYSVVELNEVRHVLAAAVPRRGSSLAEQTWDALQTIRQLSEDEGVRGAIVSQSVFLAGPQYLEECQAIIREFYGPELPATTYVFQPPCDGKLVAIEALGVGRQHDGVQILRINENLVIARHSGVSWIHCAHITPATDSPRVYDRTMSAFHRMAAMLLRAGVGFERVIRTWLYLGDIVGKEGDTQRYMEMNRARSDFYQNIHFQAGRRPPGFNPVVYPASTGIGTEGCDIIMSCIALDTGREDIVSMPLENPLQRSAFAYSPCYGLKSPKFCRAMALSCGPFATIFISGTASITNEETQHLGDVVGQTHQTLDNIEALISSENLARHGMPGLGTSLEGLACARVYVKHKEDFPAVREVCARRLGELPTVYAVADVCRPELLVEIEGIAFCHREE